MYRLKWLKNRGITTIMDVDDYWSVDKNHPMYQYVTVNKLPEKKLELMSLVDYISTTTPIFADIIEKRIKKKNVILFPNAVDETESQFMPKPIKSERIRFSFIGGSSQYDPKNVFGIDMKKCSLKITQNWTKIIENIY